MIICVSVQPCQGCVKPRSVHPAGQRRNGLNADEPVILLADDLAPSETVQLDKSKVLSFVTRHGSTNSHTAILARTMNIPALIGVDFPEDVDGKMGIVDGYEGKKSSLTTGLRYGSLPEEESRG